MIVRKDPGPDDTGIRYYRPKPYLFIGPGAATKDSGSDSKTPPPKSVEPASYAADAATPDHTPKPALLPILMRIEYLPDYSDEYSINMTPGLGIAQLGVNLDHGWNLTSVNAKTDQK